MAKNAIKLFNILTVINEESTAIKRGFVLEGFCAGQSSKGYPGYAAEKYLPQKDFTKNDLYLNIEEIPPIKPVQKGSEGEGWKRG